MLNRTFLIMTAMVASLGPARAAVVQPPLFAAGAQAPTIQDRWVGAWVVTSTEMFSDCNGFYTDNRASGPSVTSRGRVDVPAGTPAHVDAVTVTSTHLTLSMTASQRLLVSREYRDYTLRAAARCQIDLKVMLPPGMPAGGDILGIEAQVQPIVRRYPNENAAVIAAGFLPSDDPSYTAQRDTVLAQEREFQERQRSEAIEARMNEWIRQTSRIQGQISNDPDYLAGFARGVEAGRATAVTQCAELEKAEPAMQPVSGPVTATFAAKGSRQKAWSRGYQDGVRLTQGLEAIRVLPQCAPATPSASGR